MTMKNRFSNHRAMGMHKKQTGITLIESLIALVVAALGILGVVGVQMRTLVDTQASVNRGYAISLIDDLAERIQTNPDGLNNLSVYTSATPTVSTDCSTAACTPSALANYDTKQWLDQVATTLPGSTVKVFIPDGGPRQLGVLIGWPEKHYSQTGAKLEDTDIDSLNAQLMKIIPASTTSDGKPVECPAKKICHLQYVQPTQRCTPWGIGENALYCPS
jgi:type IV pilus assembly protein PilV